MNKKLFLYVKDYSAILQEETEKMSDFNGKGKRDASEEGRVQASSYRTQRTDPQAEYAEEFRASVRAYRQLRDKLGMQFQEAQVEVYEQWNAWDEAM